MPVIRWASKVAPIRLVKSAATLSFCSGDGALSGNQRFVEAYPGGVDPFRPARAREAAQLDGVEEAGKSGNPVQPRRFQFLGPGQFRAGVGGVEHAG